MYSYKAKRYQEIPISKERWKTGDCTLPTLYFTILRKWEQTFKTTRCRVLQGTKSFVTKLKGKKKAIRTLTKKFEATGKSTRFCKALVFKYGLLEVTGVPLMPLGAQTWQINTLLIYLNHGVTHTQGQSQTQRSILWGLWKRFDTFSKSRD